jgi:hypothetical protein
MFYVYFQCGYRPSLPAISRDVEMNLVFLERGAHISRL